jgi:hypothetical protein
LDRRWPAQVFLSAGITKRAENQQRLTWVASEVASIQGESASTDLGGMLAAYTKCKRGRKN